MTHTMRYECWLLALILCGCSGPEPVPAAEAEWKGKAADEPDEGSTPKVGI